MSDKSKLQTICQTRLTLAEDARKAAWDYNSIQPDSGVFTDVPDRNLALLKGDYWDRVLYFLHDSPVRRSSNQILSKINSKLGMLSQGRTEFFIQARRVKYKDQAKAAEGLINAVWEGQHCDRTVERLQKDTEVYGFGIIELGWRYESDSESMEGKRGDPQAYEGMGEISPGILNAFPENPEDVEQPDVEDEQELLWPTKYDDVFIRRVSPRRFYLDPQSTSTDLSDARYIIKLDYVNATKVKNDTRYNAKQRKQINGGIYNTREDVDSLTTVEPEARSDVALAKLYHFWGYWDLSENGKDVFQHVVYCPECDEPLLVEDSPYDFGDSPQFPFRILPGMTPDQDEPYPITGINQVADLQLAYDESFSQLNEVRRKSLRMMLVAKDSVDKDMIFKLERGGDGAVIEVDPALMKSIMPYPKIPVDTEVYKTMELLPTEITRGLGISEFAESMIPTKNMTATEANAVLSSGNSRLTQAYELQRDFKADLAYCLICLYQQFADKSYSYQVTDEYGASEFKTVNAESLRGTNPKTGELDGIGIQFLLTINSDNKSQGNREAKVKSEIDLLTALLPFIQVGMINPLPILRNVLTTAEVDNIEEILKPSQAAQPTIGVPGQPGTQPGQMTAGQEVDMTAGMNDEQVAAALEQLRAGGGPNTSIM